MGERLAIYARLSQDRDGAQTATARQIADCRALAEARGWPVADVYEDTDLTAYRRVNRPGYERPSSISRSSAATAATQRHPARSRPILARRPTQASAGVTCSRSD